MRFGVLGPLAVRDDNGVDVRVPEAKVRALLADLLAHDGGPVSADRLIHDLWGDRPPGRPAGALQAKVSQLRRVLGRDRVVHQPSGYRLRLDGDADEVDAVRFRDLVDRTRDGADPATRAALLTEALELWRGPAYADFADQEFARGAAQRLTEQRLSALEEQAEARLALGDQVLLAGELADLVVRHPLRERFHALRMRALYAAGRQSEALAAYEELRARLVADLGVDPSPELAALHQAVLRQDPELTAAPRSATRPRPRTDTDTDTAADTEATAGAAPASSHLPAFLTPLIGRDEALVRLSELLHTARLVTLSGPGGVGKTRLAVAAADAIHGGRASEDLPDGTWFVEFSGVRHGSAAELAQVVAAALGISDHAPSAVPVSGTGTRSPAHHLAAVLRDRRTLLILDNCEHVVDAAAELVSLLLRTAPGLRVLATSQEPLGVPGEEVFLVEPLPTDDAVRLFTQRAAAAPGFSLAADTCDGADHAAVTEICRRLDGIPLALELAATRVRALGVHELAARLGDRFQLLTSGRRGAPERQQTLRAVIDWSWELLSAPERIVLRRLAAFSDGCDLQAAEAVCAGDGVTGPEVPDLVIRLVDRSLVDVVAGPAGPRYRLLESVAAYATERLHEMEDLAAVSDRHLRHYLALAERAEPELRRAGQRTWLARLDAESGNLRAALDEAVRRAAAGAPVQAARLATALSWWWLVRGRLAQARRSLRAVLDATTTANTGSEDAELALLHAAFALLTGDHDTAAALADGAAVPDPVRRARSLWLCAYGLFSAGAVADSGELNDRALTLFTSAGDQWGTAAALGLRAALALVRGDLAGLGRDGWRSAALFREVGDRWGELQTVSPLAALAEIRGEYEEAAHRQYEGLRMARELGLAAEESARMSGLGRLALLAGDWDRARDLHEQARAGAAEQGYKYGEIHAEMGLALGARRSGDLDAAEAHLEHLRDGYADVSSLAGDHLVLAELGFVAELRGDAHRAAAHHLRGLEVARTLGEPRGLALSLEGLAGAAALHGTPSAAGHAALLLGAAEAARRSVGAPLPPAERTDVDRITRAARTALGDAAFTGAFERGTRLTPEEALRQAAPVLGR
ncbi:BTAD domain-containing putative transcriptional regulator [Kitasatospora sp. SUK 42]|uniref:BTAD domain-containing putative transcriptional regulator n=1 Tax=Kitasatospora sp. SUK 42 TaxID=1588882 RepID=UPI001C312989|nr:BTAD domain-containing putative transcriptional regulator [Kitasatospora sp. SUK 42]MBV2156652.1 AAA family ATPase [Kitasatospora sp. SUK 42]